jgi:processive 1,2-diacylglycerol beta-glucosyltransferase
MVIIKPIPGQEERNADYLLESGAAVRSHSNAHTIFKLEALLKDPDRLGAMAQAARQASHPRAAFDIAATVMGALG